MSSRDGDGDYRAQKSLSINSNEKAKVDENIIISATAIVDHFIGLAENRTFESRDEDALGIFNLSQPGQAVMHIGLIAADYRIGLLEAENRALRSAYASGTSLNESSRDLFPDLRALRDAYLSDLLTIQTGRMPELSRFERRLWNADTRAKIIDAARALQIANTPLNTRKPADIVERQQ
ncbi:conserved hypothetical protein [Pseudomonas sp. 8Z]|uniref:hypothetical protein n=1 Tax=Pseudomonas sp. 8Z TaxID=2653166 RepID=UPI0012F42C5C|nr:hypothetical protein [Pseudomonas sp. 8Z]VXC94913.1 conserved hypothetical protein [Pseudomonas sp. 8Z]